MAFDGTGSTDPRGRALTYAWDFGDDAIAAGAHVQHTYAEPGTYRAVLSVENGEQASNCGITGDCAVFVTVAAPAGAPPTPPPVTAASAGGCGCGSAAPDAGLLAVVVALVARMGGGRRRGSRASIDRTPRTPAPEGHGRSP